MLQRLGPISLRDIYFENYGFTPNIPVTLDMATIRALAGKDPDAYGSTLGVNELYGKGTRENTKFDSYADGEETLNYFSPSGYMSNGHFYEIYAMGQDFTPIPTVRGTMIGWRYVIEYSTTADDGTQGVTLLFNGDQDTATSVSDIALEFPYTGAVANNFFADLSEYINDGASVVSNSNSISVNGLDQISPSVPLAQMFSLVSSAVSDQSTLHNLINMYVSFN
jgi:hypothetical protein